MFTHIASIHKNEIYAEGSNNSKLEERYDCGEGTCKKMYYKAEEKKYWCQKCFRISQISETEKPKPEKKPRGIKRQLCPECGASTTQLKTHIDRHHGEISHFFKFCFLALYILAFSPYTFWCYIQYFKSYLRMRISFRGLHRGIGSKRSVIF